jgi:protein involved in polysaccharide export with SLBB domain
MKKLLAVGLIIAHFVTNTHAQVSGLNVNTLMRLTGSSNLQSAIPNINPNQAQMMGVDPAIMKILNMPSGEESASENAGVSDKPNNVVVPKTTETTPTTVVTDPNSQMSNLVFSKLADYTNLEQSYKDVSDKLAIAQSATAKTGGVYGYQFFNNTFLQTYTKSTDIKAPDSYVLSEGDELTVAVWGFADYNGTFKINKEGFIQIPEFGRVYVKGLTFGAAKSLISKRLASFINPKNTQYEITLNFSRNISVSIVGEVTAPGSYQLPAVNSVFNSLNAANGPSVMGSVRNIEVRREGKVVKIFDLYDFLFNPSPKDNFYLQEADFIFVPNQGKVVEITGAVKRPYKYELTGREDLRDLVRFAGGLQYNAYTKVVQVKRFNGERTDVIDINLNDILSGNSTFVLKDGDMVSIPAAGIESGNYVELKGTVLLPGKYQFVEGLRVSDLIKVAGGLLPISYMDRAYLRRKIEDGTYTLNTISIKNIFMNESASDNVLLQQYDVLEVFSKDNFIEKFQVSISGSVKKPVAIDYSDGITLNDLLFYAGGIKKEAANNMIEISRVLNINKENNTVEPTRVVIKTIEIGPNLEIDEASKAFVLSPMDEVHVRKTYEFDQVSNVDIEGEVKFPGSYGKVKKDEKVLDIIKRAGGLSPYAHIPSARLYRRDSLNTVEVLDLMAAFSDSTSHANYTVKDGDIIIIPMMNPMVSVRGAVRYPGLDTMQYITAKYEPGRKAKHYINKIGGGFAQRAKRRATMVLHPNGDVGHTKSILGIKKYPTVREGSQIITYYKKPKPPEAPKQPLNWNLVLPSIIVSLSSVASTIAIIFLLQN